MITNGGYTYSSFGQSPRRTPLPQVIGQNQADSELNMSKRYRNERTLSMPCDPFDITGFESQKLRNNPSGRDPYTRPMGTSTSSMMMSLSWNNKGGKGISEFQPTKSYKKSTSGNFSLSGLSEDLGGSSSVQSQRGMNSKNVEESRRRAPFHHSSSLSDYDHFEDSGEHDHDLSFSSGRSRKDTTDSQSAILSARSSRESSPCLKRINRHGPGSLDLGNPKVLGLPPLPLKSNSGKGNLKYSNGTPDDKSSYEQLKTKLKEVSDKCFNSNNSNKSKVKMTPSKLKLFSRFYKTDNKESQVPLSPSGRKVRSFSFGGIPQQDSVIYDEEPEEDEVANFELRVNPLYVDDPTSPTDLPDHVIMGMSLDDFKAYHHHNSQKANSNGSGASNNSDGDSGIVNETLDNHSIFLDSEPHSSTVSTKCNGSINGSAHDGDQWDSSSWLSRPNTPSNRKTHNHATSQSSTSSNNTSLQLQGEYKLVRVRKFPPFPHPMIKTKSMFTNMNVSLSSSSTLDLGITLDKNLDEASACGYVIKDIHPDSSVAR